MPKLSLDRNAHFLKNSFTLAHLADAAYAGHPASHDSFKATVFSDSATAPIPFEDKETDTEGFVCGNSQHVVVAFRGTEPIKVMDWITDLSIRMVEQPDLGGYVHEGFERALDAVWDKMIASIKKLSGGGQTLWVTGHSLGGALATLMAAWLPGNQRPFSLSTFGQPRVGDHRFAGHYHQLHFRFVNNRDIVPTVPPRTLPGNFFPPAFYAHVGDLQFFDKSCNLVPASVDAELGVLPALVTALGPLSNLEAEATMLILNGLEDHKMKNYLRCLKHNQP